jgi:hypothetical protein
MQNPLACLFDPFGEPVSANEVAGWNPTLRKLQLFEIGISPYDDSIAVCGVKTLKVSPIHPRIRVHGRLHVSMQQRACIGALCRSSMQRSQPSNKPLGQAGCRCA